MKQTQKMDRSALVLGHLDDGDDEKEFWKGRTPAERLEALELMRQIVYGYDPATLRFQRVFEISEFKPR
ncbi:MAG: hypothetical protein K1X53_15565 [Candidatus Sumerlaeaceae bacterium]|nr:hypothetical protein [Candidatus Sumerlaeaceae bacterium]